MDDWLESAYEDRNGGDVETGGYELSPFIVEECDICGAPGDTDCRPDCDNHDFRNAELEAVLDEE